MEVMEVKTMRRAFGFCALLGLALCATPAGAAIEEYDTVSPINMTIDSFEYMNAASRKFAACSWHTELLQSTPSRNTASRTERFMPYTFPVKLTSSWKMLPANVT